MREMMKMVVVLTLISAFSGGLLAAVKNSTEERIEIQKLEYVKGPVIRKIFEGATNDPIKDRFKIEKEGKGYSLFAGVFDGKAEAVALEAFGKGFGGNIGVIVGVDIKSDKIIGVGVTNHNETPGLGARASSDAAFAGQFKGRPLTETFKVRADGGQVDALSGATFTSRGVADAITTAGKLYKEMKPQIEQKLKSVSK
ncbi:MAG: RnfABCDGE type electron transport complex subunit G [Desulfobacteraceae bacterium]|nr:MAG: RnfABCDGE type electron transport complex subunit G [Desulfobacteraceae bacterium]